MEVFFRISNLKTKWDKTFKKIFVYDKKTKSFFPTFIWLMDHIVFVKEWFIYFLYFFSLLMYLSLVEFCIFERSCGFCICVEYKKKSLFVREGVCVCLSHLLWEERETDRKWPCKTEFIFFSVLHTVVKNNNIRTLLFWQFC